MTVFSVSERNCFKFRVIHSYIRDRILSQGPVLNSVSLIVITETVFSVIKKQYRTPYYSISYNYDGGDVFDHNMDFGAIKSIIPELNYYFFVIFFCLRGSSPSLPRDFTVYTVTQPVLRVFQFERCRIRTRDHCLSCPEH